MNKPVRNDNARFVTTDIARERYNLCREKLIKLAREAGALIKYGRTVRIDVEKLDSYFVREYAE